MTSYEDKPEARDSHLRKGLHVSGDRVLLVNDYVRHDGGGSSAGSHVKEHVVYGGLIEISPTEHSVV